MVGVELRKMQKMTGTGERHPKYIVKRIVCKHTVRSVRVRSVKRSDTSVFWAAGSIPSSWRSYRIWICYW